MACECQRKERTMSDDLFDEIGDLGALESHFGAKLAGVRREKDRLRRKLLATEPELRMGNRPCIAPLYGELASEAQKLGLGYE